MIDQAEYERNAQSEVLALLAKFPVLRNLLIASGKWNAGFRWTEFIDAAKEAKDRDLKIEAAQLDAVLQLAQNLHLPEDFEMHFIDTTRIQGHIAPQYVALGISKAGVIQKGITTTIDHGNCIHELMPIIDPNGKFTGIVDITKPTSKPMVLLDASILSLRRTMFPKPTPK